MCASRIKRIYWSMLSKWQRCVHPLDKVISPHPWMKAIEHFVPRDQRRVVYIDGGAHDGQVARMFLKHYAHLEVHAFEPNSDLLPGLTANLAQASGKIHQAAIGAACGHMPIHINMSPMTSSLLPRGDYGKRYFDAVTRPKETRIVPITTLDAWSEQENIDRVDILKLDLQGYELEALRGARQMLNRGITCIFTEINFVPLYEGSALFSDIDLLMREHGYRLLNLYNLATKQQDWQLSGGDALYVLDHKPTATGLRKAA